MTTTTRPTDAEVRAAAARGSNALDQLERLFGEAESVAATIRTELNMEDDDGR